MNHRNQGYESAQRTCRDMDDTGLATCLETLARCVVRNGGIDFMGEFVLGQLTGVLELIENRRTHFMYHTAADRIAS